MQTVTCFNFFVYFGLHYNQWRCERYDGTSSRTGPLRSKKTKHIFER